MAKQKQRSIDQIVSKASQSLPSHFVLASKMKIKQWKTFVILMFVAGFSVALVWSTYNSWYIWSKAVIQKTVSQEMKSKTDPKLIQAYQDFPMHGSSGIISAKFGENNRDTINDETKRKKAIQIHKEYDLNTFLIPFNHLTDKCTKTNCNLSLNGKKFLRELADNNIRPQIDFNLGNYFKYDDEFAIHLSKTKLFLKDLNDFKSIDEKAYQNILSFFIGDDIGIDKKENVEKLADCIRSEIYGEKSSITGRPLDIPLSLDTGGKTTYGAELAKYVEIVGGYDYPLLTKEALSSFLNKYQNKTGIPSNQTFTFTQAHSQAAYNALFSDSETETIEHSFPEGVQISSLMFHNLRSGVSHFMIYNDKYLESEDVSADRLAEVGLVNKMIDIIWEPILKESKLNNEISYFGVGNSFGGDVLNFRDGKGDNAALLIISIGAKANYIVGKMSEKKIPIEYYRDKDDKQQRLTIRSLGLDLTKGNIGIYQIQFPEVLNIGSLSQNNVTVTVPQINENSLILLTADAEMIKKINVELKKSSSSAKNLLCEAFNGRARKTQSELDKIKKAGGEVPAEYIAEMKSLNDKSDSGSCGKLNHQEIRNYISEIGDLQVDVYNYFRGIDNSSNALKPYPDFSQYVDAYWENTNKYKKTFLPKKLASCEAQRFNFYLLDRYIKDGCRSKE
jgi:hypothetical protein